MSSGGTISVTNVVRRHQSLLAFVYLVLGVSVAAAHDYFDRVDAVKLVLSAVLAVAFWPLVLLGINLRVK
jgi:protein gp37